MKILMCQPDYYGIKYEINPWMNIKQKVDHQKALQQWKTLYDNIAKCGAQIELISPVDNWPDMTFTANAGLFYKNKIILSHLKYKERQGEETHFQDWFSNAGFVILNSIENHSEAFFEGAGDALFAGDKLFVGYGFRSERAFYKDNPYFDQTKLIYCELSDPYFYHLDTCFCPINNELAIWYPAAFSADSQKKMAEQIELLAVNKDEAKHFACNAVVLNKHVILPTECPEISSLLQARGFETHPCAMDEYLKAGGACKCLTLRIDD